MRWRPDRPAWHALCAAAAAVLLGAAGIALDVALASAWTRIDSKAVALPAQVELTVQPMPRCPHCGWIEAKHSVAALGGDAQALLSYEYTVRMGDGSSRVFREELPVSWRLGERLIFIDGARGVD